MSTHGRSIRRGTTHHRALAALAHQDCSTDELTSIATGSTDTQARRQFRQLTIMKLHDLQLIEMHLPSRWRLTSEGRAELQRLVGLDGRPAANDDQAEDASALHVEPHVPRELLTRSVVRPMSDTDRSPAPIRSGGLDFAQFPSRRGNRLYYRDGRVTDLDGNPIHEEHR